MSNKAKILDVAIKLFSEYAYDSISTKRIAIEAGVSEGLIFRHYSNKEKLLQMAIDRVIEAFNDDFPHDDEPRMVVQNVMELAFGLTESQRQNLKFLFNLCWQSKAKLDVCFEFYRTKVELALKAMNVSQAFLESELVMSYMYGFCTRMILGDAEQSTLLLSQLRSRYVG